MCLFQQSIRLSSLSTKTVHTHLDCKQAHSWSVTFDVYITWVAMLTLRQLIWFKVTWQNNCSLKRLLDRAGRVSSAAAARTTSYYYGYRLLYDGDGKVGQDDCYGAVQVPAAGCHVYHWINRACVSSR